MSARHQPSSDVRSSSRRWWLGGLVAIAVVVVAALLLGGGDDDPKLTFVDGAPDKGFPLRGNLAGDDAAIRKAADAWLADDAREDDDEQVLDHDDDVEMTALWAGRIGNNEVVVLAEDHHAALVTRRVDRDGAFSVHGVRPIRDAEDPRLVVFGPAILTDRRAEAAFAPAGVRPSPVAPTDGLWTTRGDYAATFEVPDGALVMRNGLPAYGGERTAPVAVVVSDHTSVWQIDDALMTQLLPGPQAFSPPAYQRLVAATAIDPGEDGREGWDRYSTTPPELRLVQDRALPVLGRTMVLTAELGGSADRLRILAATGGSTVAGKDDEAEALPLGDEESGESFGGDPPLAAAIVDRATQAQPYRDASVFVAGSRAIRSIEVLSGTERTVRPGPVAIVALPEASAKEPPRSLGDIAIIGRTRDGTIAVPDTIAR